MGEAEEVYGNPDPPAVSSLLSPPSVSDLTGRFESIEMNEFRHPRASPLVSTLPAYPPPPIPLPSALRETSTSFLTGVEEERARY